MNPWKKLFTPTIREVIVFAVLGAFIMLVSNINFLTSSLFGTYETQGFNSLVQDYTTQLGNIDLLGRAINILIWVIIGTIVYLVGWAIINAFSGIHDDVIIGTSFTQYKPESRTHYWSAILTRGVFRFAAALMLIVLSIFVVTLVYPVSVILTKWLITEPTVVANWLWLLGAIAVWVCVFCLYSILLRLLVLRSRVFTSR